jgi:hypothetical protein
VNRPNRHERRTNNAKVRRLHKQEAKRMSEKEPEIITLTISFHPASGRMNVDGPIENEMLCDYLMKKAGKQIERHNAIAMQKKAEEMNEKKIQIAPANLQFPAPLVH